MRNKELLERLKQDPQARHFWEQDYQSSGLTLELPTDLIPLTMTRGSFHKVPGRGKVKTTVEFSPHYVEPVARWLSAIRLGAYCNAATKCSLNADGVADARKNIFRAAENPRTTTWLRCAVDFELYTSIPIKAVDSTRLSWAQKANALAAIVRTLVQTNRTVLAGMQVRVGEAFPPTKEAVDMSSLGVPAAHGFKRSMRGAHERSLDVTAVNAVKADAARVGQEPTRGRRFGDGWMLSSSVAPRKTVYVSDAMERLQTHIGNTSATCCTTMEEHSKRGNRKKTRN